MKENVENSLRRLSKDPKIRKDMPQVVGFLETLKAGIREGSIVSTGDFYNALEEYQQMSQSEVNLATLFCLVGGYMFKAIEQYQAGQTPPNFFELDQAFSIVSRAITDDERLYSLPDFEQFKEVVRQVREVMIEPKIAKLRGQAH